MSDFENPTPKKCRKKSAETRPESSIGEELTVAGNQLVREVERLITEGNVRRLIIKQDDKVLLEVSLTLAWSARARWRSSPRCPP
jgi:hypothetical protein